MSELTTIHGAIYGAFGSTKDWRGLYLLNKNAIDALPEIDEWPPLVRSFFSVPMSDTKPGFFRIQMIHFGCSFNHFSDDWSVWLEKFEKLISRMYWHKVRLHLEVEIWGKYDYLWKVSGEQIQRYYETPPKSPTTWEFSGGPREFG